MNFIQVEMLKQAIDRLGQLKAAAAEIAKQEKDAKAVVMKLLAGAGATEAEGNLFRVAISTSVRETLDMDAVRAKLSPQFITAHTKETEVVTVRVSARSADQVKAAA